MRKYLKSIALLAAGLIVGFGAGIPIRQSIAQTDKVRFIESPELPIHQQMGQNQKKLIAYFDEAPVPAIVPFAPGKDPESKQVIGDALRSDCRETVRTYFSQDQMNISVQTDPRTGKVLTVAVFVEAKDTLK